jgi:hypothetical protein
MVAMTDLTFPFAVIGALWVYWRFVVGVERLVERVQLRLIARRRREPVTMAPLPRAVGIPTVTRRAHPRHWIRS